MRVILINLDNSLCKLSDVPRLLDNRLCRTNKRLMVLSSGVPDNWENKPNILEPGWFWNMKS